MTLRVIWVDSGREPKCAPDPEHPDGVVVDMRTNDGPSCETDLPYPARRCGHYMITCKICKLAAIVTTAGRPDDPRHVIVTCKKH